jgi:hypothetical protein
VYVPPADGNPPVHPVAAASTTPGPATAPIDSTAEATTNAPVVRNPIRVMSYPRCLKRALLIPFLAYDARRAVLPTSVSIGSDV